MSRKTAIRLTGDALTAARAVRSIYQQARAQKGELEREFQERLNELGRDAQERMSLAWAVLMNAADLPMEELGEWELDASYLDDHGCAFLSKREAEDARPSLGDLLQSMTASKH